MWMCKSIRKTYLLYIFITTISASYDYLNRSYHGESYANTGFAEQVDKIHNPVQTLVFVLFLVSLFRGWLLAPLCRPAAGGGARGRGRSG